MVPTSLLGVLLFVGLLAPGLAYVLRHEKSVPARSHSAFREGLRVIFVSIACLAVAGVALAVLRALLPSVTPDVGLLVRDRKTAIRTDYVAYAWWAVALLLLAVPIGGIFADHRIVELLRDLKEKQPFRWIIGGTTAVIRSESAWYKIIHLYDDAPGPVYVGAQLNDGTYVEGYHYSFNVSADETKDREMILRAPLLLTTTDGCNHALEAQFTVISASNIVRLDVSHLESSDLLASTATN
jgi:hypothetical protein